MSRERNNCLSLIKLIAALQVMYGHITTHLGITTYSQFDKLFGVFQGVPIFFTLSGFLIWFSIDRIRQNGGGYREYISKRFWRIYPEMWLAIAVGIVVMCVLYDGWNLKDVALFSFTQGTIFQFWTPDSLRGYGCGTPNGSLWTMGVTIQFYIIAWFLFKVMQNRKWTTWTVTVVCCVAMSEIGQRLVESLNNETLIKLYGQTIIRYLWLFMLGMGLARFSEQIIPFCRKGWPGFFVIGALASITEFDYSAGYGIAKAIFVLLTVVGFAYEFPGLKLKIDISFGIFIYHMTVVNAMITFKLTGNIVYGGIAAIISCLLGYLSTISVGKLSIKKRTA